MPTAHSSGALYDLITRTYDLQTASLTTTVTASGVTVDLPADSQLVKVPDFTVIPAPWGPRIPGHYILQPARVPSYLTMTSPPEETNYAPENGLIDIFYKADGQLVHLSSGETRNMNVDYEVADGLISVNILPPHGSNETVMGNIRIRAYPNGEEWHTFTTMGQHLFETPPGVYEVRVEDVPADPDAGHNGYTRNSYPTHPYFVEFAAHSPSPHPLFPVCQCQNIIALYFFAPS